MDLESSRVFFDGGMDVIGAHNYLGVGVGVGVSTGVGVGVAVGLGVSLGACVSECVIACVRDCFEKAWAIPEFGYQT